MINPQQYTIGFTLCLWKKIVWKATNYFWSIPNSTKSFSICSLISLNLQEWWLRECVIQNAKGSYNNTLDFKGKPVIISRYRLHTYQGILTLSKHVKQPLLQFNLLFQCTISTQVNITLPLSLLHHPCTFLTQVKISPNHHQPAPRFPSATFASMRWSLLFVSRAVRKDMLCASNVLNECSRKGVASANLLALVEQPL